VGARHTAQVQAGGVGQLAGIELAVEGRGGPGFGVGYPAIGQARAGQFQAHLRAGVGAGALERGLVGVSGHALGVAEGE
nr:hypothetical protein [Tanacetum cinerariifolium]